MRSTDLFSIFLPKQWTMLRLRSTSLLSIPPTDPLLQFPMLQGAFGLVGPPLRGRLAPSYQFSAVSYQPKLGPQTTDNII